MSYLVTARKWRPRLFRDVVSQAHVTGTLKNAIKNDRVGHAYLFSGPRGVGKTTVARIFAKALNCLEGPAEEPCNACENCLGIQSGSSMDVQELDGASNNSVDDVRNLISSVGYHASSCRYKMYIIDEVHMLSTPAFNALLKTLEEPPPNVIFVFATTEPHRLPVTVLSRCQRFDFHRLSVQDIAGKLRMIADSESLSVDDESLMLIARRAGGAMRDAESILEQLKSTRGDTITVADVNDVLGIADRMLYFDVIDRCHERDVFGAISLFKAFYDEGGDAKEFVEGMLAHLRDLLYARHEGGIGHVMLSEDMKTRIVQQADRYDVGDIVRMIRAVADVESSLPWTVLPVVRIETALARMALQERTIDLENLIGVMGGAPAMPLASPENGQRNRAAGGAGEEPAPVAETPPEDAETDETGGSAVKAPAEIGAIRDRWKDIVAEVGERKPMIAPTLACAVPAGFTNGVLDLAFEPGDDFHLKTMESNSGMLSGILEMILGEPVTIRCVGRGKDAARDSGGAPQKKKSELDDLISREPIVGDILRRFDGDITDTWRD